MYLEAHSYYLWLLDGRLPLIDFGKGPSCAFGHSGVSIFDILLCCFCVEKFLVGSCAPHLSGKCSHVFQCEQEITCSQNKNCYSPPPMACLNVLLFTIWDDAVSNFAWQMIIYLHILFCFCSRLTDCCPS